MIRFKRLRTKITGLFILIVAAAVFGTAIVAAKVFVTDKRDYVMDLNSVATPGIADAIGKHLDYLQTQLPVFGQLAEDVVRAQFPKVRGVAQLDVFEGGRRLVASVATSALEKKWVYGETILVEARNSRSRRVWKVEAGLVFGFWSVERANQWEHYKDALYLALLKPEIFSGHFDLMRALTISLIDSAGNLILAEHPMPPFPEPLRSQLAALAGGAGRERLAARELQGADGSFLAFVAPVPDTPGLAVLVQAPAAKVSPMIRKVVAQAVPFVLIVLVLASVLGVLFSLQIARPVEELTEATSRIASGHWRVEVRTKSQDEIGRLVQAFSTMGHELSEREKALRAAHDELVRAERLAVLGRFGAGIAHEVKNPLNGILSHAQLMERMLGKLWQAVPRDAGLEQSLKFVLDETRRANSIISDLLTFSRQKPLKLAACDLGALVSHACEMVAPQAAERKVTIERKIPGEAIEAPIDRDQIIQVLLNLMTNAFHAMEEKPVGEARTLTARVAKRETSASIELTDTGTGISPENQKKLFEPFFTTKGEGKGTGLGLSLCHGIISQHRGKITVSSVHGEGTTFTIELPLT